MFIFNLRKSPHGRHSPGVGLGAINKGDDQGLLDLTVIPSFVIRSNSALAMAFFSGLAQRSLQRIGAHVVWISCSTPCLGLDKWNVCSVSFGLRFIIDKISASKTFAVLEVEEVSMT